MVAGTGRVPGDDHFRRQPSRRHPTVPLAIYISQSSNRMDEAIALSLILVLVSLVVMIFRRERSGAG